MLAEPLRVHGLAKGAERTRPGERADRDGRLAAELGRAATRTSSAAASGSATASRGPWPSSRSSSPPTRPSPRWTSRSRRRSSTCSPSCRRSSGLTYLFIAHDLSVVRHISDRIAVMYLGEVVEQSPSYELYRNPLHPYTSALVSAVPIPDPAIETKRRRLILVGDVPSPANPPSGCRFHTRCWLRRELKNPERCVKERPVLRELLPDHTVACHLRGGAGRQGAPPGAGRQGRRGDHRCGRWLRRRTWRRRARPGPMPTPASSTWTHRGSHHQIG